MSVKYETCKSDKPAVLHPSITLAGKHISYQLIHGPTNIIRVCLFNSLSQGQQKNKILETTTTTPGVILI